MRDEGGIATSMVRHTLHRIVSRCIRPSYTSILATRLSDSFTHEKEYQPPQACVRDAANFVAAAATMVWHRAVGAYGQLHLRRISLCEGWRRLGLRKFKITWRYYFRESVANFNLVLAVWGVG